MLANRSRKWIFLFSAVLSISIELLLPNPAHAESVQDYVRNFITHSQKYSQIVSLGALRRPEVSIRFTHLDSWVHGQCTESPTRQEILLNATYWNELSEFQRELLVYHELGHCVLKRDHDERMANIDGQMVPQSIMHPHVMYMISEEPFRTNANNYFEELFSQNPNQPFVAYVREGFFGGEISSAVKSLLGSWPQALPW